MTIVLAVKRTEFVVLAADRLWHGPAGRGVHTKIVAHRQLPIAVATAGFAFFPLTTAAGSCSVPTTVLIDEILAMVSECSLPAISGALRGGFESRVRRLRQQPGHHDTREKEKLDLFIAFARPGSAELARLRLTEHAELEVRDEFFSAPASLKAFYSSGRYANDGVVYGDAAPDAESLAQHLRRVVADGIKAEAALYGGCNRECGGGIDLAIICATGARFPDTPGAE